jgi:hypothetical protein
MARFFSGLNRDITNLVELHHYVEVEDMVHMAIRWRGSYRERGHQGILQLLALLGNQSGIEMIKL